MEKGHGTASLQQEVTRRGGSVKRKKALRGLRRNNDSGGTVPKITLMTGPHQLSPSSFIFRAAFSEPVADMVGGKTLNVLSPPHSHSKTHKQMQSLLIAKLVGPEIKVFELYQINYFFFAAIIKSISEIH